MGPVDVLLIGLSSFLVIGGLAKILPSYGIDLRESETKEKEGSLEYFFEQIKNGNHDVPKGVVNDSTTYRVPGSDFYLYIDYWNNVTYYCTVSHSKYGEIFDLKYKDGYICDFNNKSEMINLENADIVKAYINNFLTKHTSKIIERERSQTEINNKMKNDRKISVTPVKLDKVIVALLGETKEMIKYISTYMEELSVEEEHHFEQLRDTDIPTLLETYQRLDKEKQKKEKENLLEGLELIKLELEDTKKRVQTRTTRQFEKRVEIAKQRKRDREIGEM